MTTPPEQPDADITDQAREIANDLCNMIGANDSESVQKTTGYIRQMIVTERKKLFPAMEREAAALRRRVAELEFTVNHDAAKSLLDRALQAEAKLAAEVEARRAAEEKLTQSGHEIAGLKYQIDLLHKSGKRLEGVPFNGR